MVKKAEETDAARGRQVAALPWRVEKDGSLSVLLITSRTNAKWMLPKGWPMAGKTDAEAAQQEALEEAGMDGVVSEAPIGSYYFIKLLDDGTTKPSQAIVYSLRVTGKRSGWDEKAQRRRRWFRALKAAKAVYEPDLARLLTNVAAGRIFVL
jgi:8-oxo-dGTP pyrophosphatase MutT (NUDIX family)